MPDQVAPDGVRSVRGFKSRSPLPVSDRPPSVRVVPPPVMVPALHVTPPVVSRSRYSITSRPPSSWRLNQSQPAAAESSWFEPNSWSIQLVPLTSRRAPPAVMVPRVARRVNE